MNCFNTSALLEALAGNMAEMHKEGGGKKNKGEYDLWTWKVSHKSETELHDGKAVNLVTT